MLNLINHEALSVIFLHFFFLVVALNAATPTLEHERSDKYHLAEHVESVQSTWPTVRESCCVYRDQPGVLPLLWPPATVSFTDPLPPVPLTLLFVAALRLHNLWWWGGFQKKTPSRTTLRFFFVRFKRDKNRDTCCESAQCVTMIHRGEWRPVSKRDVVPTRTVFSFHRNGLGELLQESTFIVTISFILSMSLVLCVTQLKICERCSGGIFFDQMKKRKI